MNTNLWSNIVKEAFDKTLVLAKFFCTLHLTNTYIFTPAYVTGPSMIPTFKITGGFVLAEKISTRFGKVGKGDIVLIRSPEDPRKIVTKRVVGMEGDSVDYSVNRDSGDVFEKIAVRFMSFANQFVVFLCWRLKWFKVTSNMIRCVLVYCKVWHFT
ncbi:hypothetical protein AgCh_040185 [Apium graveolens]